MGLVDNGVYFLVNVNSKFQCYSNIPSSFKIMGQVHIVVNTKLSDNETYFKNIWVMGLDRDWPRGRLRRLQRPRVSNFVWIARQMGKSSRRNFQKICSTTLFSTFSLSDRFQLLELWVLKLLVNLWIWWWIHITSFILIYK